MKPILLLAFPAIMFLSGGAFADAHCALSYETFEESVPHTDMEECPGMLGGPNKFCRYSVNAEVATIFVFDEDSQCLIKAHSYYDDEFSIKFGGK